MPLPDFAPPALELSQSSTLGKTVVVTTAASTAAVFVTTLPASPTDGQTIVLVDSPTSPTYRWQLIYNASSASAYKWEFVGGSSLFAEVVTAQGTASTSYVPLATAGPSIALPVAGDYEVRVGANIQSGNAPTAAGDGRMSYDIGGTAAVDADAVRAGANDSPDNGACVRTRVKTGLTAVTLTAKYRASTASATATFADRWMSILPVRVG